VGEGLSGVETGVMSVAGLLSGDAPPSHGGIPEFNGPSMSSGYSQGAEISGFGNMESIAAALGIGEEF